MSTTELNAIEAVQTALATIRQGHLNGGDAAAALRTAQAETREYEAELAKALDDEAELEPGAAKRAAAKRAEQARKGLAAAQARAEAAQDQAEAARRVVDREQRRIPWLRKTYWWQFHDEAEESIQDVIQAAQALAEPLRHYLETWQRTAAKWSAIHGATIEHLLELDREAGRLRDLNSVMEDAALPAPPIDPAAAVSTLNVVPRPRFLNPEQPS